MEVISARYSRHFGLGEGKGKAANRNTCTVHAGICSAAHLGLRDTGYNGMKTQTIGACVTVEPPILPEQGFWNYRVRPSMGSLTTHSELCLVGFNVHTEVVFCVQRSGSGRSPVLEAPRGPTAPQTTQHPPWLDMFGGLFCWGWPMTFPHGPF